MGRGRARSLRRQDEVAREFASFMAAEVLTAPRLWDELLNGSRSRGFWRLLALRIDSALGVSPDGGLPNVAGQVQMLEHCCVQNVTYMCEYVYLFIHRSLTHVHTTRPPTESR